jgi:hypothetical protein
MPGMKITLGTAMRVRDVSQPGPDHVAAAQAQAARAQAAQPDSARPPAPRPRPDAPAPARPAAPEAPPTPGVPNEPTGHGPADARNAVAKKHRSRRRFPR